MNYLVLTGRLKIYTKFLYDHQTSYGVSLGIPRIDTIFRLQRRILTSLSLVRLPIIVRNCNNFCTQRWSSVTRKSGEENFCQRICISSAFRNNPVILFQQIRTPMYYILSKDFLTGWLKCHLLLCFWKSYLTACITVF